MERAKRLSGRGAIERLARLQDIAAPPSHNTGMRSRRIVGPAGQEFFLLSTDEIYGFQADGDLVRIVTSKTPPLETVTYGQNTSVPNLQIKFIQTFVFASQKTVSKSGCHFSDRLGIPEDEGSLPSGKPEAHGGRRANRSTA